MQETGTGSASMRGVTDDDAAMPGGQLDGEVPFCISGSAINRSSSARIYANLRWIIRIHGRRINGICSLSLIITTAAA